MSDTIEADPNSAPFDEPEPVPSNWEHTLWGVLLLVAVPFTLFCFGWMGLHMWCDPELHACAVRETTAEWWRQAGGIMTVASVLLVALRFGSRHRAVFFTRWAQPRY